MDIQETLVRQQPLTRQIEQILIERIYRGKYLPDSQLPAEVELAEEFNVSRATLRSALNTLATLGMIVRRHGGGTFVTRLARISNPLDLAIDFHELISNYCCQPSFRQVYCDLETANAAMAKALGMPGGGQVLVSHKVFTADDEPIIFCVNTIEAGLFHTDLLGKMMTEPDIMEPFFIFLEREIGLRVEYFIASIRPVNARKCRFNIALPIPGNTPILEISEVAYTAEGRPIFHSVEYHPENKMSFELIRRRSQR